MSSDETSPSARLFIRPATLGDSDEIARIHVSAWQDPAEPRPTLNQRLELWHHLLGGGPRRIQTWVTIDPLGEILGFAGAGRPRALRDRFDGELAFLYVPPPHQYQGVGSALIQHVKKHFKQQKFSSAMAWVPELSTTRSFFLKHGATQEIDRREVRQSGITLTETLIAWKLK